MPVSNLARFQGGKGHCDQTAKICAMESAKCLLKKQATDYYFITPEMQAASLTCRRVSRGAESPEIQRHKAKSNKRTE
ncbi:hypothetical protein [Brucella pecoris]|uniref:Uncharacterized protein n=1 Tax=Brucella pecoris TaxID=867683 RepID=A0A5C5CF01_9HYPH|nr:hypothetical protein [Brucella pecoris]TNV09698.1 hypothetical protein FIB18_19850 [Brucella pecoris]